MKKKYKTIQGQSKQGEHPLTLENLIRGTFYHKQHGWIEAENKEYNKAINEIIDIIGGRYIHPIMFVNRSHWSFQRFMYDPKQKQWNYCAGQDYPAEMKQIRKFLKN